ncbi:hypothetical protein [Cellulomonas cellasea]|uniref:Uncharacterized protein n=1 Tax=Cellulomonas cellasea TaxID=43670 RepID=A0A7W4UI23_9CELL|nr:hypothetical protein [Cellulomonas cellasea]MBB2924095.1 hypothetical protein [Cellulomonas cellasea]
MVLDPASSDHGSGPAVLRRDGYFVRVIAIQHQDGGELHDGILVGRAVCFALEPLSPMAAFTVRCTTPVVSIKSVGRGMGKPDE